jgi:hypothetical protein
VENGDSWIFILAGVGALLLLLLSAGSEPASTPLVAEPLQVEVAQEIVVPEVVVPTVRPRILPAHVVVVDEPAMAPPVVDAGSDLNLGERQSVRLRGDGYDPDGGPVTAHWTAECDGGFFNDPHRLSPLYTAPSICCCERCIRLTLTLTDEQGETTSDDLFVRVSGDAITCPVPPCEPCGEAPCPGPVVCDLRDPCAPEPLPCEGPCVERIAAVVGCSTPPEPCCDPCVWFGGISWPCDEEGECGWAGPLPWEEETTTTSACLPGRAPVPFIYRDYASPVHAGEALRLFGEVVNPDCVPVCFTWEADKGWFDDSSTLTPVWNAPAKVYHALEEVCITLTVKDNCGGRAYDQIRVRVAQLP